jgi:hypothetical protein
MVLILHLYLEKIVVDYRDLHPLVVLAMKVFVVQLVGNIIHYVDVFHQTVLAFKIVVAMYMEYVK